jgi:hypothetical protein
MATHWIPDTDPSCKIAIEKDGSMSWVIPSKVHATPQDVLDENQTKNMCCAECEKAGLEFHEYDWKIEGAEREVIITVKKELTKQESDTLESAMKGVTEKVSLG